MNTESHRGVPRVSAVGNRSGRDARLLVSRRKGQPIPHPGLCEEVDRSRRLQLDLLAQLIHEHAEVIDLFAVVRSPDGLQEFAMRDGFVCVGDEVAKQLELLRCQSLLVPARPSFARVEIDRHVPRISQVRRLLHRRRPPQRRPDSRRAIRAGPKGLVT